MAQKIGDSYWSFTHQGIISEILVTVTHFVRLSLYFAGYVRALSSLATS